MYKNHHYSGNQKNEFSVILLRSNGGFGIEFDEKFVVTYMSPTGSAKLDGTIQIGDKIRKVNDIPTSGGDLYCLLEECGEEATIVLRRQKKRSNKSKNCGRRKNLMFVAL